jgi:hypothetical protein
MKRWLRGSVVLATVVGLTSCSGDPTDTFRGGTSSIVASPSSVFLNAGSSKGVVVQAIDDQGNPLAATFTASAGSGITVVVDSTFLPSNGAPIEGQTRFLVTGNVPANSSFEVSADDKKLVIPVRSLPTEVPAEFSNPTPAQNEAVTVTAPGFTFLADAGVIAAGDTAVIVARAADGSSITFVPKPGAAGAPTLFNVSIDIVPGVKLSIPSAADLTVPLAAAVGGTDDPATAPSVPAPAAGLGSVFYDVPDFATTIDHFYKLVVPEAGDYDITVDWSVGTDIDVGVCPEPLSFATCDFSAASNNKPESGTFTLTAGTYYILVEDFGEDAAGATVKITMAH